MGCVCNGYDTKSSLGGWNAGVVMENCVDSSVCVCLPGFTKQSYSLTFPAVTDLYSVQGIEDIFILYFYALLPSLLLQNTAS